MRWPCRGVGVVVVRVRLHVRVCEHRMHVLMCVRVRACARWPMIRCFHLLVRACVHVRSHVSLRVRLRIHRMRVRMCLHVRVRTRVRVDVLLRLYSCECVRMRVRVHVSVYL